MKIYQKTIVATVSGALIAGVAWLPESIELTPSLSAYQQSCARALGYFETQIARIEDGKYSITSGEAWRPPFMARVYASQGKGIANSLHSVRLARDYNLFVNGVYRTDSEAHKPLAEFWMQIGPQFGIKPSAGYYFEKQDGNHYGCQWGNVK
jgi:hypothetical protein